MLKIVLAIALAAALTPAQIHQKACELYQEDKYQEAATLLVDVLPEVRESEDQELLAECLSTLAASYCRMGAFNLALNAQRECYSIDLDAGDPSAISSSLNNLAAICLSLEDYAQATDFIMEAIWHEEPLGDEGTLAIRYGIASEVLLKAGRVDEAVEYASRALELDRKGGRTLKEAVRKSQLAAALTENGSLQEAATLLDEAIPVFERENSRNSLSISLRELGRINRLQGNTARAAQYYRRALEISTELGNKNHIKSICKDLAETLRETDPKSALGYMRQAMEYSDSIFTTQTFRQIAELRMENEIAAKDREITDQRKALRNRLTYIVLLLFLLILLGVVVSLQIRNSAIQKKNNEILSESARLKDKLLSLGISTDSTQEGTAKEILKHLEELGQKPHTMLTAREREVAEYCCKGMLTKDIAEKMNLSHRTVETHKNNIFRKLGINTTVELVNLMHEAEKL